jgi:hypothetical protein
MTPCILCSEQGGFYAEKGKGTDETIRYVLLEIHAGFSNETGLAYQLGRQYVLPNIKGRGRP